MADCIAPPVICNAGYLQDPITQRYLLMHMLASLINLAGGDVPTDDGELFAASEGYLCQGSPAKLRTAEASAIAAASLDGVDLTHVTCYSPLAIESAIAYLTCTALGASPPSSSFPFTWSPDSITEEQFWAQMGSFAFQNDESLIGVTDLVYNGVTYREGIDVENALSLATFNAPNLVTITDNGYLEFDSCPLTQIDCPVLETVGGNIRISDSALTDVIGFNALTEVNNIVVINNTSLTDVSGLNALVSVHQAIYLTGNGLMTDITGFASLRNLGGSFLCTNGHLTAAGTNRVLAKLVTMFDIDGTTPWAHLVDITGPDNAAPTGQGVIDAGVLSGRGATVQVN